MPRTSDEYGDVSSSFELHKDYIRDAVYLLDPKFQSETGPPLSHFSIHFIRRESVLSSHELTEGKGDMRMRMRMKVKVRVRVRVRTSVRSERWWQLWKR